MFRDGRRSGIERTIGRLGLRRRWHRLRNGCWVDSAREFGSVEAWLYDNPLRHLQVTIPLGLFEDVDLTRFARCRRSDRRVFHANLKNPVTPGASVG